MDWTLVIFTVAIIAISAIVDALIFSIALKAMRRLGGVKGILAWLRGKTID